MIKNKIYIYFIIGAILILSGDKVAGAAVFMKDGNSFIVDRYGEKWDVTQAKSLGFEPKGFQYGIGRNAILPLDGKSLSGKTEKTSNRLRVIGVANDDEAHGYSVRKLVRHEIANTTLGSTKIAAAY
ncbi:MAG: DUF3179 domain-containing protein [Deltaproteobacteria bacterium]|nr:DUF3179 domain-containing protein [Deltaproteobacteria bacterium]